MPKRKDNAVKTSDVYLDSFYGTTAKLVMPASMVTLSLKGYLSIGPPFLPCLHMEFRITSGQGSFTCGEGPCSSVLWEICNIVSTAQRPIS